MTARPQGLFEAWRLDGDPGPVARADAVLDAERRRFTLAASRARDRVVFTASRVDGRGEPSRFLRELGLELPAEPPALDTSPLGSLEAAGALRRVAGDRDRPAAERLAAATTLAAIPGVDPATWWWRRDYTVDPEPIAAEGRLRTSYSRIGTYEDCHLKYFFGSVAGLDDRSSYQMAFGRLMHTIFELAAKGDVANEPDDLKAAYRRSGSTPLVPVQGHRLPVLARRHGHAGAVAPQRRGRGRPPRPAVRGRVRDGGRGHLVRGRIDRVDPGRTAASCCSTTRPPATPRPRRRPSGPPARHLLPGGPARPRAGRPRPPGRDAARLPGQGHDGRFTRVSQHPGPDHASKVEQRLLALLDGAAAESFDPDPHADCRMCPFKPICPMWPQGEEFLARPIPPRPEPHRHPLGRPGGPERGWRAVSPTLTGVVTPGFGRLRPDPTPEQLARSRPRRPGARDRRGGRAGTR